MTLPEGVAELYQRLEAAPLSPVWISLVPRESALARAREVESSLLSPKGASCPNLRTLSLN